METEIWEDLPGYEGVFKVSNLGAVKSLARKSALRERNGNIRDIFITEKLLSQMTTPHGYKRVQLNHAGKKTKKPVHVLIAQAFIPNPENKPCVNHINGIKTDNRVENLEWVTYRENALHSIQNRTRTGVVGIYFHPTRQRYQGAILVGKKRHGIGDHKTIESAIEAYRKKAELLGVSESRYLLSLSRFC